jgi:hypothetical protein
MELYIFNYFFVYFIDQSQKIVQRFKYFNEAGEFAMFFFKL